MFRARCSGRRRGGGDHVDGDALGERQRRRGVAEHVQRPGGEPGGLAKLPEPLGQGLRVNRPAERVGENEVTVHVGVTREVALEELRHLR